MGVKATVVYDVTTHTTLVLRTLTTSISDRYSIIDTIASFSQHCESLRGAARSVTDVAALWGGPPYINYNVIRSRFRAIVIWDQQDAEFDIAYDVQHSLIRLENAVEAVADELVSQTPSAIRHVYHEAGYALRGEKLIELSNLPEPSRPKNPRSSSLQLPSRRSSIVDQKKKKTLFGKLSASRKSKSTFTDDEPTPPSRTKRIPSSDSSSVRAPSGNAALSVALHGSEDDNLDLDHSLGKLQLPDAVFAWADFGGSLPNEAGDLDWFGDLLKGEQEQKKRPRAPSLRSSDSDPAPPSIPPTPSDTSLPNPSNDVKVAPLPGRNTSALGTQVGTSLSNAEPNRRPASASQSATGTSSRLSDLPSVGTSAPSYFSQDTASGSQIVTNSLPPLPQSVAPSNDSMHAARNQQYVAPPPSGTPSSILQSPNLPSSMSSTTSPAAQHPPPQNAAPTPQHSFTPPPLDTPPLNPAAIATPPVPPALASRSSEEDFDIAGLGTLKDNSTVPSGAQNTAMGLTTSNGVGGATAIDEGIRASMNGFANTMQAGNFTLALQQVYTTLKKLSQLQPRREREVNVCAYYVLAQKILIRNAVLETELSHVQNGTPEAVRRHVESALLSMFLAELKHLLPRHRVAAMKVAIDKNFNVGNFGMCARWLRRLLEKAPPAQQANFTQKLQVCVANGEQNKHMPPTNRLCYMTLQVLSSPFAKCTFCPAVYHAQLAGVVAGQLCPICFSGNIYLAE